MKGSNRYWRIQKRPFKIFRNDEKRKEWQEYHIVDFRDLDNGTADKQQCALEVNKRVVYAKKYMKNTYDRTHYNVLKNLTQNFTIDDKLNLSLDAICVINKNNKRK